jgi:hypothetical protein
MMVGTMPDWLASGFSAMGLLVVVFGIVHVGLTYNNLGPRATPSAPLER